ncbi:MAG: hypothetical protein HY392_04980 [Candidatus Diapherotrites archaeon]|nr:hypothetical protein [Candidatus Diapherotrites archaeon]
MNQSIGGYAFLAGAILAVIAAVFGSVVAAWTPMIALLLVILGLVVGFMNVTEKEVDRFLIAAIALLAAGTVNLGTIDLLIPPLGTIMQAVVRYVAIFVAPAALVVALKSVMDIARS